MQCTHMHMHGYFDSQQELVTAMCVRSSMLKVHLNQTIVLHTSTKLHLIWSAMN